jgi:hypothetical protein
VPVFGRRRKQRSGAARIAIHLSVPAALGLTIGGVLAFQAGSSNSGVEPVPLGLLVSPTPSDTALTSTASTTLANNVDCDIIVPANPLSARGLATPYQLTGTDGMTPDKSGCRMSNAAKLGAFVQATILDPATGTLSVYDPLVITQGTRPAVLPRVPVIPADAVVTIDIGFNGKDLFQVGATPATLAEAGCVSGHAGSDFGQVSFCNGISFFDAAFRLENTGRLAVPPVADARAMVASAGSLGTGLDCPTTRNFDMVDQDPSDNVTTQYLLNPATGQTAQDNTANKAMMPDASVLNNGSDNALIDDFLDPALGCTPFEAPSLDNRGAMTTSQALDELFAARNQPGNAALVPENDEMVQGPGASPDVAKTDLYRAEIGEAPVDDQTDASSSPTMFCQNLVNIQTPFLAANQSALAAFPSPVPAVGDTLYTFMANRLLQSFSNLGCQNFGLHNPVQVVLNGAGAATEATLNTAPQEASF